MKTGICAIVVILMSCLATTGAAEPRLSTQDVTAKPLQAKRFDIQCSMDARYGRLVEMNAEAFYDGMVGNFFDKGWAKPLVIHYSQTQSDTSRLLKKHGFNGLSVYGVFKPEAHAIYTHWEMDDGGQSGWGTLFHEMVHAFTQVSDPKMPAWCNEGLATFLGERTRVVKGKISVGRPNPWRELILRDKIEKGYKIDVRKLMSMSTRKFYADGDNYHTARVLFYWLHHKGKLKTYLKAAKRGKYAPSVLVRTVRMSYPRINAALLEFVKKHCYPAAYCREMELTKNPKKRKMLLEKALEANPESQMAMLKLGKMHRDRGDQKSCRDALKPIIADKQSTHRRWAMILMASGYYREKDYASALTWYEKALDYSQYNVYGYELYANIANCYIMMKNYAKAREYYEKYLAENWRPDQSRPTVAYAKHFIAEMKQR